MAEHAIGDSGDPAREAVQVLQGILSAIQGVVGEGAAQALLRYGAFEEGKRLAAEHAAGSVEDAFAVVRRLARLDGTATMNGTAVRVEVRPGPFLEPRSPILDTLLLGVLEGAFYAALQSRLKGRVAGRSEEGVVLHFERDTA